MAAGPWNNDSADARRTARSNSESVEPRVQWCSQTRSILQGRTGYRLHCVHVRKESEQQCPMSLAAYMQVGCSLPRTSLELPQWNPPASLVAHYTVNFIILSYAAGSSPKRLIGTLSTIPQLDLIYQLNDQPNKLSVTTTPPLSIDRP